MNKLSHTSRFTLYDSHPGGFSLIELIVVVALIGIMAAIATPQLLKMMPGMRVNNASRQVIAKMLLLRIRAVSENKDYQIVFTAGGNQYQIKKSGTIVETGTLPSGIIFGTNATKDTQGSSDCVNANGVGCLSGNAVSFTPTGTAKDGAGAVVPDGASVYLIPSEDRTSGRTDRMRAVSISGVGKVKAWKYGGGGTNPWDTF